MKCPACEAGIPATRTVYVRTSSGDILVTTKERFDAMVAKARAPWWLRLWRRCLRLLDM